MTRLIAALDSHGVTVGNGPDHEPLVTDVRPIAWLRDGELVQAWRCYEQRFAVGRASTD